MYFHSVRNIFDFAEVVLLISAGALGSCFAGFLASVGVAQLFEGIALQSRAFALYTLGQSS
jgi:hypothetical protein